MLQFTFEIKDLLELRGEDSSYEKRLLYTCIVAAVQKVYLEKSWKPSGSGKPKTQSKI